MIDAEFRFAARSGRSPALFLPGAPRHGGNPVSHPMVLLPECQSSAHRRPLAFLLNFQSSLAYGFFAEQDSAQPSQRLEIFSRRLHSTCLFVLPLGGSVSKDCEGSSEAWRGGMQKGARLCENRNETNQSEAIIGGKRDST